MSAKLYGLAISHPSQAARAMLERKGIEHEISWLIPGMQPVQLRALGFRAGTVPAMKLDGERVQTSRAIARALEEAKPEPRLFPRDPEQLVRVEDAERWGDEVLQPVPRQIFRWAVAHSQEMRTRVAKGVGVPAPSLMARINAPVARRMARLADASDARVPKRIAEIPALLDRVDELIAEGVIGGAEPNAADYQIGSTVRTLMTFEEVAPAIERRPAAEMARRLFPEMPGGLRSGYLPAEWVAPLRAES